MLSSLLLAVQRTRSLVPYRCSIKQLEVVRPVQEALAHDCFWEEHASTTHPGEFCSFHTL
jgi:hypothetical protein